MRKEREERKRGEMIMPMFAIKIRYLRAVSVFLLHNRSNISGYFGKMAQKLILT